MLAGAGRIGRILSRRAAQPEGRRGQPDDREQRRSDRRQGEIRLAGWGRLSASRRAVEHHPESAHRPGDVLDLDFAHVDELDGQAIAHLVAHGTMHADAAGLRQRLQARGHVDAVAEHIATIGDDVAQVHADAERELARVGAGRGARRHVVLNGESAAHRLHHAGEFGEEAIAHALEDAPLVLRRSGSQNLLVHGPEIAQGSFLVLSH